MAWPWPAAASLAPWLAALAALAAVPAAVARGPAGGGYHTPFDGEYGSGAGEAAPLHWLRQSREGFERLMRLLAERSVQQGGVARVPPPPDIGHEEPPPTAQAWPPGPEEPWAPGASADDWRTWFPFCREAGVQARPGGWYVVRQGDTLWSIAEAHYGYGEAYRRILRANAQRLSDRSAVQACQRLYIPRRRWGGGAPVAPFAEPPFGPASIPGPAASAPDQGGLPHSLPEGVVRRSSPQGSAHGGRNAAEALWP